MALVSSELLPGMPPPSSPAFSPKALASLLCSSSNRLGDFVWNEHERPLVAHNEFDFNDDLPVIDMAALESGSESERQAHLASLAEAGQKWGFFQLVNHGVSRELICGMDSEARSFFKLRLAQKMQVLRDHTSSKPMGYMCGDVGTRLKKDIPWLESLQVPAVAEQIDAYSRQIWQCGNAHFRKVATDFSNALKALAFRLLRLLIEQLRLRSNSVLENLECGENSVLRLNFYPPCPQPSLTLGLGAHSDPHLLTILHQDNVGGLQILRDANWMAVRPREDAFVVNIGDALQVLSNGIYSSVEHRAVCNSSRSRLSMGFFLNPADKSTLAPALELTTPEHPPKYRGFSWQEYRQCMYENRSRGKSNLKLFEHRDFTSQTTLQ